MSLSRFLTLSFLGFFETSDYLLLVVWNLRLSSLGGLKPQIIFSWWFETSDYLLLVVLNLRLSSLRGLKPQIIFSWWFETSDYLLLVVWSFRLSFGIECNFCNIKGLNKSLPKHTLYMKRYRFYTSIKIPKVAINFLYFCTNKQTISHCRNSSKIKFDTYNAHLYHHLLFWLVISGSVKRGGVTVCISPNLIHWWNDAVMQMFSTCE